MSTTDIAIPTAAPSKLSEPELVTRIRDQLKEMEETANKIKQTVLNQALRLGELLLQAKERVGHGKFGQWLEKNALNISERSAQRYMALKEQWPKIEAWMKANSATVADLSLRKAEKIITSNNNGDGSNDSDKYDNAQKKLIEHLKKLDAATAEAAANKTIQQLAEIVATKTGTRWKPKLAA